MTWRTIAARDLREYWADGTLRNFAALFGALGLAAGVGAADGGVQLAVAVGFLALGAAPLTAVLLAHDRLPTGVASGRARLTLSLPHSRRAYVAGTAVGVLGVAVGALALAVGAAAAAVAVAGAPADAGLLAALVAVGVALAAALVGGTFATTATLRSSTLAAGATAALYCGALAWPGVVGLATTVAGLDLPRVAVDALVVASPVQGAVLALAAGGVTVTPLAGALPWWAGVVSLGAWSIGGTAAAVHRFAGLDL